MGEIADDLIEGRCCQLCPTYFEQEHGYPVVCHACWKDLSADEREIYQKSTNKEFC